MAWHRVVDAGGNTFHRQLVAQRVPVRCPHDGEVMVAAGTGSAFDALDGKTGEGGIIARCRTTAPSIPGVEPLQLHRKYCGLNCVQTMIAPSDLVAVRGPARPTGCPSRDGSPPPPRASGG